MTDLQPAGTSSEGIDDGPGGVDGPGSGPPPGGGGPDGPGGTPRRRSRVVLWTSLGVAVVIAVFVAVLASSKPVDQGSTSSPLIGKPAPPIAGTALTGSNRYSLAGLGGRWVLVNFSASWCDPCRQETPQLVRFEQEHSGRGDATILAVEFDPTDDAHLASFLTSSRANWPAISDPSAEVSYGVTGIPESYLVDPRGTVVAKFFGGVTAAEVDKVIARSSSAS